MSASAGSSGSVAVHLISCLPAHVSPPAGAVKATAGEALSLRVTGMAANGRYGSSDEMYR